MKKTMTRIGTLILCLALCFSLAVTASAAGSAFTVTAGAVSYSEEAQTVTVTIAVDPGAEITAYGGNVVVPEGWSVKGSVKVIGTDAEGDSVTSKKTPAAENNYSFNNTYADGMTATSVEITYNVPAEANGTFTLGVENLILSKNGMNQLEGNNSGVIATTEVKLAPAQVYGFTLTLKGEIGMNAYLLLSEAVLNDPEAYQVEFWNGDTLVSATKAADVIGSPRTEVYEGVSYTAYPFSFNTVPKEMDTVHTMKLRHGEAYLRFADRDGNMVDSLERTVNNYLNDRLLNSQSEEMKALAKAMQNYGAFARHYFTVLHDPDSADPLPEVEGFALVDADVLPEYTRPGSIAHFTYVGSTLVLESETSFRLYFESDDVSALTITEAGKGSLTIREGQGNNAGRYYVQISNIAAKDLDTMYTFTISNGETSVTAYHGPYGYVRWAMVTEGKTNLQYLVSALYDYNAKAKAYFASIG